MPKGVKKANISGAVQMKKKKPRVSKDDTDDILSSYNEPIQTPLTTTLLAEPRREQYECVGYYYNNDDDESGDYT